MSDGVDPSAGSRARGRLELFHNVPMRRGKSYCGSGTPSMQLRQLNGCRNAYARFVIGCSAAAA